MDAYIFISVLALVALLLIYTYKQDKYMKEPIGKLLKAYGFGLLAFPGFFIFLCLFVPLFPEGDDPGMLQLILSLFCISSVPMEGSKLFFLWLLLRRNDNFNEYVDGIIYATFISLGFATLESMTFLLTDENTNALSMMELTHGLLAAPANWFFGILMGYYYSLAKFSKSHKGKYALLTFAVPVLAHAAYDFILSILPDINPMFEGIAIVVLLFLCYKAWIFGNKRIHQLLERDKPFFEQEDEQVKE